MRKYIESKTNERKKQKKKIEKNLRKCMVEQHSTTQKKRTYKDIHNDTHRNRNFDKHAHTAYTYTQTTKQKIYSGTNTINKYCT